MQDATEPRPLRASRTLSAARLVLWLLLVVALPLAALTLNIVHFAGFPLGFWITAQGAILALAALAWMTSRRRERRQPREGWLPACALAASATGAVAILGAPGSVVAHGYDGLPLALGLVGGLTALAVWIAPRVANAEPRALAELFAGNAGNRSWPAAIAALFASIAAAFLIAADLRGAALALAPLAGLAPPMVMIALAAITAVLAALPSKLARPLSAFGLIFVLALALLTLVALSLMTASQPYPHLGLGYALQELADVDQRLIMGKLADFSALRPMASPFLQLSMTNVAGLLLATALGLAAAPHLLRALAHRQSTGTPCPPTDPGRRAARATLLLALIALSAAPLAIYGRLGFERALTAGLVHAELPAALTEASGNGLLTVCGVTTSDPAALASACAKVPGQRGRLRLQDVHYDGDAFIVAAPRLAGMGAATAALFCIAVLVAALLSCAALVAALAHLAAAPGHDERPRWAADLLALSALVAGCALVMFSGLDVARLALAGFAILAAGLFPALLLTLVWQRYTASAAALTMLIGSGLASLYTAGVLLFPVKFFAVTGGLSSADDAALRKLDMLQAAIANAATPEAGAAAAGALARHTQALANWWGLEPAAIVLVALPLALFTGLLTTLITSRR